MYTTDIDVRWMARAAPTSAPNASPILFMWSNFDSLVKIKYGSLLAHITSLFITKSPRRCMPSAGGTKCSTARNGISPRSGRRRTLELCLIKVTRINGECQLTMKRKLPFVINIATGWVVSQRPCLLGIVFLFPSVVQIVWTVPRLVFGCQWKTQCCDKYRKPQHWSSVVWTRLYYTLFTGNLHNSHWNYSVDC